MDTEFFKRQMRLLHLEDDENDQVLVREMLRTDGLACELMAVKTRTEFETALLRNHFDLIISDFSIPSFDGLNALTIAHELSPATPFIFFSGTIGEEVAVESLKNGATDYILKQRPHRLAPAVRNALRNVEERSRRRRAEIELQKVEERFRIVCRATNDVIWEWDIKADKVWFSDNFKVVFGHSVEEIGASLESWMELIHPDEKNRVVSGVTGMIAGGGRVWWSEHRLRRANGSYAHVFERASVVYDPAGKPTRMVGLTIDMTERKHAEEKIIEQAALLDEAQDAIIVGSLKGQILFWSKGAERVYGWTTAEAAGQSMDGLLQPEALLAKAALEETLKTGRWIGELREKNKSGHEVVTQSRWTLLQDARGNPKSIMVINTDITERKQLEEQFLRAQRLESLGVLVSGIAHDLNNALVPILIGVQILREEPASPEIESLLLTMETSARRSAEMLKQMLTFARGGETKKTLVHTAFLVKEMGKIITDTFPKSIQCRIQAGQNLPPISGLPTQLHQVLMNLCVNARDAMPKGGLITLAIERAAVSPAEAALHAGAKPGDHICFSVKDTGDGIAPEQLEKIFQPFFTTKAPGKGTGLGLSTSLNIVKNHGGFMTLQSEVGRGTEFKVYLPVAGELVTEAAPEKVSLPIGAGEWVLVVDDEEAILAIMRATLENYGYKVSTATSGPEAITRFAQNTTDFSLVITDLDMPFMDGHATIETLRKISPGLKFIITSGAEKETEEVRPQARADEFIAKPFTSETLIKAVHKILA
jgi:PAS domain S-box-containing protein